MNPLLISNIAIQALAEGNLQRARGFLGHDYTLKGIVVHGSHVGRTLGFPTANIELTKDSLPLYLPNGVYAVKADVNRKRYDAMTNIGIRPTLDGKKLTIETHLFEFDGDLYGRKMAILFLSRLRDERKFNDLHELVHQLELDKKEAMNLIRFY